MGVTHSTTGGAESAHAKELQALLKRHAATGDTPFHRAVRGSSNGAQARRRLEALCDAVHQHHALLKQHLEEQQHCGEVSRAPSSWLCAGPRGAEEALDLERPPATAGELLRLLLDLQNHRGQTALHLAVEVGYPEAAELLLEQGANPWLTDRMGAHMPIHVACLRARLPCVKLLLDALPSRWRRSAEDESISYVEAQTLSGFTPLHCAVASTDVHCIRAVLAHHPRLHAANRYDSYEYQLEFPRGSTPLHVAASKGNQEAAKELLRYYYNMVLASKGQLNPVPPPSIFGGQMPAFGTRNAPVPADPRLAVNTLQQLPWQAAYALHLRALAEMLHPSMPLTYFFPPPPVSTLQQLAAAVLRQKLQHALDAAQQVEEQRQKLQRLQRQRQARQQEEEEQQQQQRRLQRCHSHNASSYAASSAAAAAVSGLPPRSAPIATSGMQAGRAAAASSSAANTMHVASAPGLRSAPGAQLSSSAVDAAATTNSIAATGSLARLKQALASSGWRSSGDNDTIAVAISPSEELQQQPQEQQRLAATLAQLTRVSPTAGLAVAYAAAPVPLPMPHKGHKQAEDCMCHDEDDATCDAMRELEHSVVAACNAKVAGKQEHDEQLHHADVGKDARVEDASRQLQLGPMRASIEEEEEGESLGEVEECAVCLTAEARMQVVPCRHCLCAACSHELVRTMAARPLGCPLCRAPVQSFVLAPTTAAVVPVPAAAVVCYGRHSRH